VISVLAFMAALGAYGVTAHHDVDPLSDYLFPVQWERITKATSGIILDKDVKDGSRAVPLLVSCGSVDRNNTSRWANPAQERHDCGPIYGKSFRPVSALGFARQDRAGANVFRLDLFNQFVAQPDDFIFIMVSDALVEPYIEQDISSRSIPNICNIEEKTEWKAFTGREKPTRCFKPNLQPRSDLRLADLPGDIDSSLSGLVGLTGKPKGNPQHDRSDTNEDCGIQRIVPHIPGGTLDRLCGSVHSFLGSKVTYLPIAGFIFCALAGLGGGLILDHVNRNRERRCLGWILLLSCTFAGFTCLFFGLP